MNGRIKILYKDKFLLYSNLLIIVFFVTLVVMVFLSYSNLPPLVPLLNSMPWGLKRLYSSIIVPFLPLIFGGIIILDLVICVWIYKKNALLSRLITFNAFLVCLLGFLAYLQILFLVY